MKLPRYLVLFLQIQMVSFCNVYENFLQNFPEILIKHFRRFWNLSKCATFFNLALINSLGDKLEISLISRKESNGSYLLKITLIAFGLFVLNYYRPRGC